MSNSLRPCWINCYNPEDNSFLNDKELLSIDSMEDSIVPLDEQTIALRQIITRFESCYHEADKEAEYIIKSIAAGHCLGQSQERPPKRKKELENTKQILSMWCENPPIKDLNLEVSGISAEKLLSFIGQANPLKIWQVEKVINRISQALDPNYSYHNLVMDIGDYGKPGSKSTEEYYKDNMTFFKQTRDTIIHDTVDGHKSGISLAYAIDLLMPCHWDLTGALIIILKAIGGNLYPEKSFACCARNINLSPLCERLKIISSTLALYWKNEKINTTIDPEILDLLGELTPIKRWLTASLDKTIKLQLCMPFEIELI